MVLVIGVLVGILFLEETHEDKKFRKDMGLEAGKWLLSRFRGYQKAETGIRALADKMAAREVLEMQTRLEEDVLPEYTAVDGTEPPGYRTKEGTPRQSSSRSQSPSARAASVGSRSLAKPKGVRKAFTQQVILVIVAFGILA